MRCRRYAIRTPDGQTGVAIVCGQETRKRCSACGELGATYQCDWKLHGARAGKTCDQWICESCRVHVAEDKDLCPPHARLWDKHPKNPENASATP